MAQERKELRFFQRIIDEKHVLGNHVTCQVLSSFLGGKDLLNRIERETIRLFRTDFLLEKLAQFAFEGKVAQVAKLATIRPDLRREVLFTLAGLGAQDEMEVILRQHPEDLLLSRPLRDISGAQFESITLFQHCLWTKDVRYMANMMLDCLPKNKIGERIRIELVRQYEEHMTQGVVYQLHGNKHKGEHHFDLQPLKSALSTYVKHYDDWSFEEQKLYWCKDIGQAQTTVPAHIRHHYCDSKEAFWKSPNFKKPELSRSLQIYNWVVNKYQLWAKDLSGLGSDFGIFVRHKAGVPPLCCGKPRTEGVHANLTALTNLDATRTTVDLPALEGRLQRPIQNLEHDLNLQIMDLAP